MLTFRCKICGGMLHPAEGATTCECEFCGITQTIPILDDEKKISLFTRANQFRSACEFDRAAGAYDGIIQVYPDEAEAYWGLILCKYGIEYVDDPGTGKKIPTCHRTSYDSIFDDPDFDKVMECSEPVSRAIYRKEAKEIEELRKGIVEVSSREAPYDIFICYKETDENGNRTLDSEIAQDIYNALTKEGYRVFFSRISLEDKIGREYEPYIFAAIHSSRVMLAVGTDYEHFQAVWVKNEWSRFLTLMNKGEEKIIIPCYKNIDVYDLPKEFGRFQAQDMGKVGALQDLLYGIHKILKENGGEKEKTTVPANPATEKVEQKAAQKELQEQVRSTAPTPVRNSKSEPVQTQTEGKKPVRLNPEQNTIRQKKGKKRKALVYVGCALCIFLVVFAALEIIGMTHILGSKTIEKGTQNVVSNPENTGRESEETAALPESGTPNPVYEETGEDKESQTESENLVALPENEAENMPVLETQIEEKGEDLELPAETQDIISGDYRYNILIDGTVEITRYFGAEKDLIIPSVLDGRKVSRIGDRALHALLMNEDNYYLPVLTSITIPDSVTSIGNDAFAFCKDLVSVTIPDSVIRIGDNPFRQCRVLSEIHISPDHPYLKIIDGALISKPDMRLVCYYNNASVVQSYSVPDGIRIIGKSAFECCKTVISVVIPNSVKSIEYSAFSSCDSMKFIIIPESVTSIGYYAFSGSKSQTVIVMRGSYAAQYCEENDIPFTYAE